MKNILKVMNCSQERVDFRLRNYGFGYQAEIVEFCSGVPLHQSGQFAYPQEALRALDEKLADLAQLMWEDKLDRADAFWD